MLKNLKFKIDILKVVIVVLMMAITISVRAEKLKRISSLSPNITEIIHQLKGEKYLVGRSNSCNYPASVTKIPVVGDLASIYIEKLLTTKTDLVFSIPMPNLQHKKILNSLKIKLVELKFNSIKNYFDNVKKIGNLLNLKHQAQNEVDRITKLLVAQQLKVAAIPVKKRPRVLFVIWSKPLIIAAKTSYLNEFIELSGGVNVANTINKDYAKVSKEWILAQKIDLVIVTKDAETLFNTFFSDSETKIIDALKYNKIYCLKAEDKILRLSPRMFCGISELSNLISANFFKAVKTNKMVKNK